MPANVFLNKHLRTSLLIITTGLLRQDKQTGKDHGHLENVLDKINEIFEKKLQEINQRIEETNKQNAVDETNNKEF